MNGLSGHGFLASRGSNSGVRGCMGVCLAQGDVYGPLEMIGSRFDLPFAMMMVLAKWRG